MLAKYPVNAAKTNAAPANFNTECWFLTLQAHHLAIIPAIQRYNKQLRAVKELRRMVDELSQTRPQWERTPHRQANQQLLDRFVRQLKKINKYALVIICTAVGPFLLLNNHQQNPFYQFC